MIVLGPNMSVYMFERHKQFRYMVQYITIMQHIHTPSLNLGVRKKLRLVILFLHPNRWFLAHTFLLSPGGGVCVCRNFRMCLLHYDVVLYHTSQLYVSYIHIHVMIV